MRLILVLVLLCLGLAPTQLASAGTRAVINASKSQTGPTSATDVIPRRK